MWRLRRGEGKIKEKQRERNGGQRSKREKEQDIEICESSYPLSNVESQLLCQVDMEVTGLRHQVNNERAAALTQPQTIRTAQVTATASNIRQDLLVG